MKFLRLAILFVTAMALGAWWQSTVQKGAKVNLGIFSLSLAVKDLNASRAFYTKLGFAPIGGDGKKWQIMRNGRTVIGLFEGMFPKNTLTWNPADVRGIQKELKRQGVTLTHEAEESTTGPAYATLEDPDGNPILFDQHDEKFMEQFKDLQ